MARQIITNPEERKDLIIEAREDWRRAVDARQEWLKDKEVWYMMYNNVPPPRALKYEDEPNFVVPVTMTTKEVLHSRIYNALFGSDEIVRGRPFGPTTEENLEMVTQFMNWETQIEMKFTEVADDWIGDILTFGISPLWIRWHREVRRDKRIESFPAEAPPMYPAMKEAFDELGVEYEEGAVSDRAYIDLLFDDATTIPSDVDGEYLVEYVRDGILKRVEVYINRDRAEEDGEIDVEILEETTIYDAPKATVVDVEDFVMPPGCPTVQDAPHVFHRRYMSYNEIARMVERGEYTVSSEDLEMLRERAETRNASGPLNTTESNERLKTTRRDVEGIESHEVMRDMFQVVDGYYYMDVDGDGYDESIVITFIPELSLWLAGQYLSVLHPHGKRPFVGGRIMPRTNQWEGISIPEIVAPFQEELSAIFNSKIRKDDFTSMPWGTYRPGSGMKNQTVRIEPGVLIPTNDPRNDLNVVTLNPSTIADVGNINLLLQFMQQLTGVSDFATGSFGSRPNAPRTFGATAAIMQEGNIRFNTFIMRIQRALSEAFELIHALNQVFMPEHKEFFVTGQNQPKVVSREHLRGRYHYQLTTNTQNTNKALMRDFATFVYQNLMASPLVQTNIGAMWKLMKKFAEAHEVHDFETILPEPPEAKQRPPMDQLEEIALMSQGQWIDVLPTDDDQQHVEEMMTFLEGPMMDNFPAEFVPYLLLHIEKHNKQAALKAQAAAGQGAAVPGVQPGMEGFQGFTGGEQAPMGNNAPSPEQVVPQ